MGAVATSDQIKVEDLSRSLILSDVKGTPFSSRMRKGERLLDVSYSWSATTEDDRREGAIPENQDVDAFEGDAGQKMWNRSQRFWRTPRVTVEAEKLKGRDSVGSLASYDNQKTKKIRAQKKDIEKNLLSYQDSQEDKGIPGEGNGRKFKGLGRVIDDGTLGTADAPMAIPAGWRTPTAQIYTGYLDAFTEDALTTMLQARFDNNGATDELTLWAGSKLKTRISKFFGRYTPNVDGYSTLVRMSAASGRKHVINAVDMIESEYGDIEIVLCSFIGAADGKKTSAINSMAGYLTDDTQLKMRPLMYCDHSQLPYQGGGISGLIDSILGWEYGNPQQHAKILPGGETTP